MRKNKIGGNLKKISENLRFPQGRDIKENHGEIKSQNFYWGNKNIFNEFWLKTLR